MIRIKLSFNQFFLIINTPVFRQIHLKQILKSNYDIFSIYDLSAGTIAKSSAAQEITIFVYDPDGSLVNISTSVREAGKFIICSPATIKKYIFSGQLFQGEWILSFTAKE